MRCIPHSLMPFIVFSIPCARITLSSFSKQALARLTSSKFLFLSRCSHFPQMSCLNSRALINNSAPLPYSISTSYLMQTNKSITNCWNDVAAFVGPPHIVPPTFVQIAYCLLIPGQVYCKRIPERLRSVRDQDADVYLLAKGLYVSKGLSLV